MFSIAICRHSGDKWPSKTLFLTIFDLDSSIVLTFSIAVYPVLPPFIVYFTDDESKIFNINCRNDILLYYIKKGCKVNRDGEYRSIIITYVSKYSYILIFIY